jgi:hypothetical protein
MSPYEGRHQEQQRQPRSSQIYGNNLQHVIVVQIEQAGHGNVQATIWIKADSEYGQLLHVACSFNPSPQPKSFFPKGLSERIAAWYLNVLFTPRPNVRRLDADH